jgi:hypothetical protein
VARQQQDAPPETRLELLTVADALRRDAQDAGDWALRAGLVRSAEELERRAGPPSLTLLAVPGTN